MGRFEGLRGERDFSFVVSQVLQPRLLLRLSTRSMRYDALECGISHGRAPALESHYTSEPGVLVSAGPGEPGFRKPGELDRCLLSA